MGKLVLFLDDGRVRPIALDKDRLVVGRRVDNDLCLPFPAVSSEHAAILTILHDSFLEDLGSTNGTLVNGKPVSKHFLRDRDEIDIGRQRLIYLADDATVIEGKTVEIARGNDRIIGEQVERAEPVLRERRAVGAPPKPPTDGERRGSAIVAGHTGPPPSKRAEPPVARAAPPKAGAQGQHPASSASGGSEIDTFVQALIRVPASIEPVTAQVHGPEGRLTVLSGPSAGRSVIVSDKDVTVGRVGFGVAVIQRTSQGYRLVGCAGELQPTVGGQAVPAEGALLQGGETFDVAGARLEFLAPARVGGA